MPDLGFFRGQRLAFFVDGLICRPVLMLKELVFFARLPEIESHITVGVARIAKQLRTEIALPFPKKLHPLAARSVSIFELALLGDPDAKLPDDHESSRSFESTLVIGHCLYEASQDFNRKVR